MNPTARVDSLARDARGISSAKQQKIWWVPETNDFLWLKDDRFGKDQRLALIRSQKMDVFYLSRSSEKVVGPSEVVIAKLIDEKVPKIQRISLLREDK